MSVRSLSVLLLVSLAACGARTGLEVPEAGVDPGLDGGERRDGGGLDTGLEPGVDADVEAGIDAGLDADVDATIDSGVDGGPMCRPFRGRAALASLDIFVLIDSSGSMVTRTSTGVTKFDAVTAALEGFVTAPASAGLGVALTFFPEEDDTVPLTCANDEACGPDGDCDRPGICQPGGRSWCRTDVDCSGTQRCGLIGFCSGRPSQICVPGFSVGCSVGSVCLPGGLCRNRTYCDPEDYAPVAPMATLPGAASPFVDALRARRISGGTPTAPALEGTLQRARARRASNPESKVIVLLATDGFPTECDPSFDPYASPPPDAGIELVSEVAASGSGGGIETFVIGVFEPSEESDALVNLSAIARAGGTDEAIVVTTEEDVAVRLLEIFEELRQSVRSCVYAIPHAGVLPDPDRLEVQLLAPGTPPLDLARRVDAAACDPLAGGYFFEPDIAMGARPGYIELCPASCDIASRPEVNLEMQADCD